mmetsp:Transcript_17952/g.39799  ORF Transcript_17952/g.39799 Transcript_17952/m.39799 type:complete len:273 (-) Transcript_17952:429-1247(-)
MFARHIGQRPWAPVRLDCCRMRLRQELCSTWEQRSRTVVVLCSDRQTAQGSSKAAASAAVRRGKLCSVRWAISSRTGTASAVNSCTNSPKNSPLDPDLLNPYRLCRRCNTDQNVCWEICAMSSDVSKGADSCDTEHRLLTVSRHWQRVSKGERSRNTVRIRCASGVLIRVPVTMHRRAQRVTQKQPWVRMSFSVSSREARKQVDACTASMASRGVQDICVKVCESTEYTRLTHATLPRNLTTAATVARLSLSTGVNSTRGQKRVQACRHSTW